MCCGENYSCAITIIISLLLGVIAGILFFLGILTEVLITLIIAIIISLLISIFLFILIIIPRYNECVRNLSCCVLIGLIGTLLTSIITLSIDTTTVSIVLAILIGLVVFFLSLTIIKFFRLLNCIINYNSISDNCDDNSNCNNNFNSNCNNSNCNNNFSCNNRNINNSCGCFRNN